MADNSFRSYRSRDAVVAREDVDPSREPAADPLAELARLIGQGDPYGERHEHPSPAPAAQADGDSGLDWAADQSYVEERPWADARAVDDRAAVDRYAAPPAAPYHDPQGSYEEPYDDEPPPPARFFSGPATNFNGFREPTSTEAHAVPELPPVATGRHLPAFASPAYDDRAEPRHRLDDGDQDYPADDYHDDADRPHRRSGVVLIMAVLGLLVVGTAGAFGYRAMFGGSVLPTLPPIIKASNAPNKIVPKSGEAAASNSSQAMASAGSTEKLAPPPEQPVDVQQSVQNAPRVVATIPIIAGSNPPGPVAEAPPGPAPVGAAPSGAMPYAPVNPSPASVAPPPVAVAPAMPAEPSVSEPAASTPKKVHTVTIHENRESSRREQTDRAERVERAERRPRTRAVANAPLSIVPGAPSESQPPMEQPTRAAMEPRRHAESHPMALASAAPGTIPAVSSGGGYAVQVTSQRSEIEAKAAFRMLRAKYPGQFGRREPIIRRADLGSRGIYYRAFVGPFPTLEAAAEMCSSLKAAGGNCLIPRN